MKILYINSVYQYGSTGKIVKKLKDSSKLAGNDAYVIYGRRSAVGHKGTETLEENVWLFENSLEQKFDIATSVIFDSHGLHSYNNTTRIISRIKEVNPDVIHLHNIHGFYLNYPMLFSFLKSYGRPIIWTLHDCWAYTGFCAYYSFNGCEEWKNGCYKCRYLNEYPFRIMSQSSKNFILKKKSFSGLNMTLVTPSMWLKEEVAQSMLNGYPCEVIYNDVDLSDFRYDPGDILKKHHLNGKRIYLSCANIWTKQKGFNECLKLAELLCDNEILVMVGLSEKQIKRLHPNILGIKHCNVDELRNWYSTCSAFFNPSFQETFSMVNLEARACGAPVITYRSGGTPESAGPNGIVIEQCNVQEAYIQLTKAKRSNEKFTPFKTDMSEQYLKLYETVCNNSV